MTNQQASDVEIIATLKRADEEGIPALLTGQFSEIGNITLSTERLNKRLKILCEEGRVGHQKASHRHMWWLTSEGQASEIDISELDPIDYSQLEIDKIPSEIKQEILEEASTSNYWTRWFKSGENLLKFSALLIGWPLAIAVGGMFEIPLTQGLFDAMPEVLLGFSLFVGMICVILGTLIAVPSFIGSKLAETGRVSREPWEEGYPAIILSKYQDRVDPIKSKFGGAMSEITAKVFRK